MVLYCYDVILLLEEQAMGQIIGSGRDDKQKKRRSVQSDWVDVAGFLISSPSDVKCQDKCEIFGDHCQCFHGAMERDVGHGGEQTLHRWSWRIPPIAIYLDICIRSCIMREGGKAYLSAPECGDFCESLPHVKRSLTTPYSGFRYQHA